MVPNYVILLALAVYGLAPLTILAFNSVKRNEEVNANPFGPPRTGLKWQNFPEAWDVGRFSITMRNTLFLMGGTVPGVLIIAGMAAYSLAKLDLPGAGGIMLYLVAGSALPAQLFMVPLFFLWTQVGLYGNLFGLMVIYWATMSPFPTLLLRSYMVGIPKDYEDAARVDGASDLQVLRHVIAPITWPGFLTAGLTTGLSVWNEFLFAVTFIQDADLKPVSTSLFAFVSRYGREWGRTSAASMMMVIPVIILFLLLQKQFVEGLTQGGLKA